MTDSERQRLLDAERKLYAMEVTLEQIGERLDKLDDVGAAERRHEELKKLLQEHSVRAVVRENAKWIAVGLLALLSGAGGVTKLVELLPQLLAK